MKKIYNLLQYCGKWFVGRPLMSLLLILALLFSVNGLRANDLNFIQNNRVTLNLNKVTLEKVIWEIQRQTDFEFVYGKSEIASAPLVTINVNNGTVPEVLNQCLRGSGLKYEIAGNAVVLKSETSSSQQTAKYKTITGTVTSTSNEPIENVAVQLKGTNTGTVTGKDGKYSLRVPDNTTGTLTFSLLGMARQETATNREVINISMESLVEKIEEIVISTGYQKIDKRLSTSSVFSLSGDQVLQSNATTLDNMLLGKVPGMVVMGSTSTPGAATKIRVRGASSISGNREPLWVVDGIIMDDPVSLTTEEINNLDNVNLIGNAISGLNPQDIERIDILKDASSTAIYGVRAANGVIVITTKKGKKGRLLINYSGNYTLTERPSYKNLYRMNSKERIDVSKEIEERGLAYSFTPARVAYEGALLDLYDRYIDYDTFLNRVKTMEENNTDWFDLLYRNSFSHKQNISISGANDNVNYYFSGSYVNDKGNVKGTGMEQYNANMKLIYNLSSKFTATVQMRGSISDKSYLHSGISPYEYAYNTSRAVSAFNADGSLPLCFSAKYGCIHTLRLHRIGLPVEHKLNSRI